MQKIDKKIKGLESKIVELQLELKRSNEAKDEKAKKLDEITKINSQL